MKIKISNEKIKKNIYFNSPKKEKEKDKEKENNSQKDTEVPSDYAPPPKHEDDRNINDILLEYKKEMFNKLKSTNYSYKSNKSKNDELNYDNITKCHTEKIDKNRDVDVIDLNLNKNFDKNNINVIKNNSPGPECMPSKNKKIN